MDCGTEVSFAALNNALVTFLKEVMCFITASTTLHLSLDIFVIILVRLELKRAFTTAQGQVGSSHHVTFVIVIYSYLSD